MNADVYTDLLRESFLRNARRPCFHIKRNGVREELTYEEVHRLLNKTASALETIGFGKESNGIVIGPNTPEWVMAYHAMMCAGGQVVPIDPYLPETEIREITRLTRSLTAFCSRDYYDLFAGLRQQEGFPEHIVLLEPGGDESKQGFRAFAEGGDGERDAFAGEFRPDDPVAVIFTSGTTGKAKGVVLTQRNFTAVSRFGVPRMNVGPDDTIVAILPLHHVFGFAACCGAALPTGLDIVFVPQIKGPLILEALRENRVSVLPAVPQMLESLYNNISQTVRTRGPAARVLFCLLHGLSATVGRLGGQAFRRTLFGVVHKSFGGNLRLVISGGSSLKKKYFDGFRLMGFVIVEGYGLTETFGPITLCPPDRPRLGSVGTVFPGNTMRIAEPNGDGVGEVLFRGSTVFPGYYRNEEATKRVFDDDGWFHTGDLGKVTSDGFLYLTGRLKDLIVLDSGKNVYPEEVEEYYASSPLIEEIGVFGFEIGGSETVAAVIVPDKQLRRKYGHERVAALIDEEIRQMGTSLPTYKKLGSYVVSHKPLPRTSTRKIKKPLLREHFGRMRESTEVTDSPQAHLSFLETEMMSSEEYKVVTAMIRRVVPELDPAGVYPRAHLELDLRLDSLKILDLAVMLEERFAIKLSSEHLTKVETVGDAVTLVQELQSRKQPTGAEDFRSTRERVESHPATRFDLDREHPITMRFGIDVAGLLSRMLWGLKSRGMENIPPDSPVIFVSNHESLLDIPWILGALPWSIRRKTFVLGKKELLRSPVLGTAITHSNTIAVEREGDVAEALAGARAVVRSGKNLIVFPEGTRTRTGEMGTFRSGVGTLLLDSPVAAVPVSVAGSFELWPPDKGPRLLAGRGSETSVTFGKAVRAADLVREGTVAPDPSPQQLAAALRERVAQTGRGSSGRTAAT